MARGPRLPRFALRLLHSSSTWGPPPSSRLRGSLRDRISPPAGPSWSQIHRAQPQHHYWTAPRTGDPVVRSSFSRGFESPRNPVLDTRCISPRTKRKCPSPGRTQLSAVVREKKFQEILSRLLGFHKRVAEIWISGSFARFAEHRVTRSSICDEVLKHFLDAIATPIYKQCDRLRIVHGERSCRQRDGKDYYRKLFTWDCHDLTHKSSLAVDFWKLSKWRLIVAITRKF